MVDKITLTLDEYDAVNDPITYGSVYITPSMRIPGLIGKVPKEVRFKPNQQATIDLFPNDLIGPLQTNGDPGNSYQISYSPDFPGSPLAWSFYLLSTDGSEQNLSDLEVISVAQAGSRYFPLPSGSLPTSGQVPTFTGSGYITEPETIAPGNTTIGGKLISSGAAFEAFAGSRAAHAQGWFAALANRHYTPIVIACIGDSFTSGSTAGGGTFEEMWPTVLQKLLAQRFPTIGVTTQGRGFLPPSNAHSGLDLTDYVVVTGGPMSPVDHYGFNYSTYDISANGGATLVYSLHGDVALIPVTKQPGGGSITYQVDSGSPVSYSSANSSISVDTIFVSLGSSGDHELTITYTASSGPFWLDGVVEQNGDLSSGIQCYNMGASGTTTGDWSNMTWAQVAVYSPSLIIIELGANDWVDDFPPNGLAWSTVITNIRTATNAKMPILLMAPPAPQGVSNAYTWQQYIDQMYLLAQEDPYLDMIDLSIRMPAPDPDAEPYALFDTDSGEPTKLAQSYVADIMASYLGPY